MKNQRRLLNQAAYHIEERIKDQNVYLKELIEKRKGYQDLKKYNNITEEETESMALSIIETVKQSINVYEKQLENIYNNS